MQNSQDIIGVIAKLRMMGCNCTPYETCDRCSFIDCRFDDVCDLLLDQEAKIEALKAQIEYYKQNIASHEESMKLVYKLFMAATERLLKGCYTTAEERQMLEDKNIVGYYAAWNKSFDELQRSLDPSSSLPTT